MNTARRIGLLALTSVLAAAPAGAQAPVDLGQIALEDLMRVEVMRVFGASERLQPVTEAPSAVTIVTADDIARYGYRTLADVLRGVRGFYVSDDRNYSYVGVRGFARAGDYNTRILLLVNGHRLNDTVYGQASIGADFGLDAAMFDRVEIIRGPASSLYGTSAFFAVINVITRRGGELNGALVDAEAGTLGSTLLRGAFGRRVGETVDVIVSGTLDRSDGVRRLSFPLAGADGGSGIADDLDGERVRQVYGRVSNAAWTLTGAYGRRSKDIPTASFFTRFNAHDPAEHTIDERVMVAAQYDRTIGTTRVSAETSFDRYQYDGVYPYEGGPDGQSLVYTDVALGARWGATARLTRAFKGGHTVTAGGEFFDNFRERQSAGYDTPPVEDVWQDRSSRQGAIFAQDELRIRPWLILNGGLRHDRYDRFDRVTPRAAVIVLPSANQSIKYLYGRAFRAPNAYEVYYYADSSALLRPESIGTHEVVWERYVGEHVRTSVAAYHYTASELITLTPLSPVPGADNFGFRNDGRIGADGLEVESEVRTARGIQGVASYALQRANESESDLPLTNSPRHNLKLRASVPGPLDGSFAALEWQFLSSRSTLSGGAVGAASVVNGTFTAPLARSLSAVVSLRNLFNDRYADPASDEHSFDMIQQNGRTLRVGVRWKFGAP
jgi:outer membrane receptor for ferrienterochelin and colicins